MVRASFLLFKMSQSQKIIKENTAVKQDVSTPKKQQVCAQMSEQETPEQQTLRNSLKEVLEENEIVKSIARLKIHSLSKTSPE